MKTVTTHFKNLDSSFRLDAEYYVLAKGIIKRYSRLLSTTYNGFSTATLKSYFEVRANDIPEVFPVLVISSLPKGSLSYQIVNKAKSVKRYNTVIGAKSNEISVLDLAHFFDHSEVQDFLGLHMKGAIMPYLDRTTLNTLRN